MLAPPSSAGSAHCTRSEVEESAATSRFCTAPGATTYAARVMGEEASERMEHAAEHSATRTQ